MAPVPTPCQRPTTRLAVFALLLAVGLPGSGARADGDHDRARDAVRAGQVMPLKAVLERLEREHPGQVLEVELEQDDGRWRYEVKLLQAGGRLVKLELDARSGALLKRRNRDRDGGREREPRSQP